MVQNQISKVKLSELDELRELCILTFRQAYEPVENPEQFQAYMDKAYSKDQLRSELLRPASEYYFVRVGDQLAGYLMLNINDAQSEAMGDDYLEVQRIYLLKTFRRNGLGKVMIEFSKERARQLNKPKIWLGVWDGNPDAIAFYEKMGFSNTGEHTFMMGNIEERDLIMEQEV